MSGDTWIALAGSGVAALSVVGTIWGTRKTLENSHKLASEQRNAEMVLTALGYFTGGSQNRTVGLAALDSLKHTSGWTRYQGTIASLLLGQLLYVLGHGRNRWETHEAMNLRAMAARLLGEQDLKSALSAADRESLANAMRRYQDEWRQESDEGVPGGRPDPDAVRQVLNSIPEWLESLNRG